MVWLPAPSLKVSPAERIILEAFAASQELPANVKKRARVVLMAADGIANLQIGREVKLARPLVLQWRRRFLEQGIRGLWDREGVLPQDRIPEAVEQAIVFDCLNGPRLAGALFPQMMGDKSFSWNVKNLARRHKVSQASVQRIWKKHGIRLLRYHKVDRGVVLEKLRISPNRIKGIRLSL
jgi:hypothetical protein